MKLPSLILSFFFAVQAGAQVPFLSSEGWQLQQLIHLSQQQIKEVSELLKYSKNEADSLERAAKILENLSTGLKQSIDKYQGTAVYEKALLQLQTDALSEEKQRPIESESKDSKRLREFQSQSLNANLSDIHQQQELETALRSADYGFIPKLQAQAQIGTWQASTRVSAQLSELLREISELQAEINHRNESSLTMLMVEGSDLQNQRLREVQRHEQR